jgi:hypothetical protein
MDFRISWVLCVESGVENQAQFFQVRKRFQTLYCPYCNGKKDSLYRVQASSGLPAQTTRTLCLAITSLSSDLDLGLTLLITGGDEERRVYLGNAEAAPVETPSSLAIRGLQQGYQVPLGTLANRRFG